MEKLVKLAKNDPQTMELARRVAEVLENQDFLTVINEDDPCQNSFEVLKKIQ